MTLFIGEPRFFQHCKAGDLVRLAHRGGTRFGFALCGNANGLADRVAILDIADDFPFVTVDGGEVVICYGRDYLIREGIGEDALTAAGRHQVGAISWRNSGGEPSVTLMGSADRNAACGDLGTGRSSGPRGGRGFNVVRWNLYLALPGGADPVKVFEATGKAT